MITHTPYFLKQTQKKPVQNRVRTSIPTFLVKTYEMLENQDHKDIVCWSDDGKSFLIKKHNEFRDQVLPQYFKHNNYSSFVRQLNMYDFHKVRNESTDSEYKNPLFQRGQQKLLSEIKRKSGDNNLNDEFSTQQNDNNEDSGQLLQNATGSNLNIDVDGSKSDNSQILSHVSSIKAKQTDLEKAMTMLIQQHETLIRENKILWDEIRRQNEQDDLKIEKIMMVLAFFLNRNNQFNQNNNNNNNNHQRSLALQQVNNRRSFQPNLEDIQQLLQGQAYQKRDKQNDLSNLYKDLSNLNNGSFSFDINDLRNQQVYQLPFNKNKKNESFAPQISQKQLRKLLETYESGGSNDKEMIEQYLQNMIFTGNNNKPENRPGYLQIEPLSPVNSQNPIKHEKPSISIFENPKTKRICDDSMNPLKNFSQSEGNLSSLIKAQESNNNDMHLNHFDNQQLVAFNKNNNSNQMRNNTLPKIQSTQSIEHFNYDTANNHNNNLNSLFKDYAAQSPNIHATNSHNSNPPLFQLSRNNSSNFGFNHEKLGLENNLSSHIRYSPSPQRIGNHDLTHSQNNIGDHPISFPYYGNLNGSFTPDHNYNEDEDYTGRSRRSSFDKNHDQSNNFSNIN